MYSEKVWGFGFGGGESEEGLWFRFWKLRDFWEYDCSERGKETNKQTKERLKKTQIEERERESRGFSFELSKAASQQQEQGRVYL